MKTLYPLTFQTIFKDKIWGGRKIKTELGKDYTPLPNCGETWELSGVSGNVSIVKNGALKGRMLDSVVNEFKEQLVGQRVYEKFGDQFPLLVKFIDAHDDLSIQVHPGDALAKDRHNSFGKNEMWYIMQADAHASLTCGFNQKLDKAKYLDYLEKHRIMDVMNLEEVSANDVFFIPAGRVHSIGKGILLAEIQQTSDVTYRIYDFDRRDSEGNTRELHTDLALDAIDFEIYPKYKTDYNQEPNRVENLATTAFFTTKRLYFNKPCERNYHWLDSFIIYTVVEGSLTLQCEEVQLKLKKGDVALLPAEIRRVQLEGHSPYILLETCLDQ